MKHDFAAATDPGRIRAENQDAVVAEVLPDGSLLFAVADGVGGLHRGDLASKISLEAFVRSTRVLLGEDCESILTTGFEAANDAVRREAGSEGQQLGSTLVAALAREDRAWIGNAGDSRAYLARRGLLRQMTTDDVPPSLDEVDQHVITNAIGPSETIEAQVVGPIELEIGDTLLLCSDGLHRVVEPEQIVTCLNQRPEAAVRRLVQLANNAGGPDNISAVVYKHRTRAARSDA